MAKKKTEKALKAMTNHQRRGRLLLLRQHQKVGRQRTDRIAIERRDVRDPQSV